MQTFEQRADLENFIIEQKSQGNTVGFVPTMGALHKGHISLIEQAKKQHSCVVASIYINPTQFNNISDFKNYPSSLKKDITRLEKAGCHAVFLPSTEQMYPEGVANEHHFKFDFGELESTMEGEFRPGHFNGVALVVSKLFHMVQPHTAYFGQKDYQQFLIIDRLSKALSFGVKIYCCPIVREESGLAMSSRNRRLTSKQLALAANLYQMLQYAERALKDGISSSEVRTHVEEKLAAYPEIALEYIQITDAETLIPVKNENKSLPKRLFVGIAAFVSEIRLIDNIIIEMG